ncbi:MAG: rhodanese-like domain-containing protein [Campylobacterales bacterium]|nr:rhodanese-like domain-containing protein [Campylobacterales bacterium]
MDFDITRKQVKNIFYWVAFIGVALYFAYSKGWVLTDFESISPRQAYDLLKNDTNVTLLDVRTPEEFSQEHIEGATLIPLQSLNENLSQLQGLKEKRIIVYCHSGARSVAASRILVKNGFVPLNIRGGITAWKSENLSIVK